MNWNSDPLIACFTLTFRTLTSFLRLFSLFLTLYVCVYGSLLLWRLVNIVYVSSTSIQSCCRAHGNCTVSTRGMFLVTFFFNILFGQCKKTERNLMHHLENIHFGFVNLPLHLSPRLTTCVQSYAVGVAGCASSTFLVWSALRTLKRAQRSILLNGQDSMWTCRSWFFPKLKTFLFDSGTSGSSLQHLH